MLSALRKSVEGMLCRRRQLQLIHLWDFYSCLPYSLEQPFPGVLPCWCFSLLSLPHSKEIMWDQNAQPKYKHFILILLGIVKQYKPLCNSFKIEICNVSLGKCRNEMSQHHWSTSPQFYFKTKFQQKVIMHPNTDSLLLTKGDVLPLLLQLVLGGT